jgi:hypothetical protein
MVYAIVILNAEESLKCSSSIYQEHADGKKLGFKMPVLL